MKALLCISVALAATVGQVATAADPLPAPTLVWSDSASPAMVRGLTRAGTRVEVRINGRAVAGVRYGASRSSVASFAAPWPAALPAGVYEITAVAARGGLQSSTSEPIEVVVPGLRRAQLWPA